MFENRLFRVHRPFFQLQKRCFFLSGLSIRMEKDYKILGQLIAEGGKSPYFREIYRLVKYFWARQNEYQLCIFFQNSFAMEKLFFRKKNVGKKKPRKNSRTLWQLTPKSSCLSLAALGLVGGTVAPVPHPTSATAEAIETASLKESCVRVTQGSGLWRSYFFYGCKWLKMKDEHQDSSNTRAEYIAI